MLLCEVEKDALCESERTIISKKWNELISRLLSWVHLLYEQIFQYLHTFEEKSVAEQLSLWDFKVQ